MALVNNGIMFMCASVVILLMDQATGCDEVAVNQCIQSEIGSLKSFTFYGIPPTASFQWHCMNLRAFKMCTQQLKNNCPGKRLPDPTSRDFYAVATTMCGSFLQDVLANANCWDKPGVQARFKSCAISTPVSTCSDSQKVNSCMEDAVRANCGQKQATLLENILQQQEEALFYPATCRSGHLKSQCMVVLAALFVLTSLFRIL